MLTIAFGRAVGLAFLYFSTGCCCLSVQYQGNGMFSNMFGDSNKDKIQICGSKLTSIITSICDGYLSSPTEDYGGSTNHSEARTINFDHSGVVEKCCKNPCDKEFLLQHCGKSKLKTAFKPKWEAPEVSNDLIDFIRHTTAAPVENESVKSTPTSRLGRRKYDDHKVRLRERKAKKQRKKRKKTKWGRKKGKPLFKWDCAYKSFGHYLLTLDHNDNSRNKIRKRKNVPPLVAGTIKPEILGGDPIVVGPRHGTAKGKLSLNYVKRGNSIYARY